MRPNKGPGHLLCMQAQLAQGLYKSRQKVFNDAVGNSDLE